MIRILDTNLRFVDYIRKYTFNQYSVKFRGIGTFSINVRLVSENLYLLDKTKQFFVLFDGKTDRQFGIIEKAEKSSDSENEQIIVISGRMSLAILDKRVVYRTIKFRGQTYEFVKGVIEDNLIHSDDAKRNMNINLELSDQMTMKQECTVINKQVTGGYLWDVIEPILEVDSLGIKFVPVLNTVDDDFRPNISEWDMTIIKGTDRRKGNAQGNVPVIFSQSVSNIKQTEYRTDTAQYRNYVYIAGEGEAGERKWFEKEINTEDSKGLTGWNRTELWIDARDIQSEDAEGNAISDDEYEGLINDRINEKAEEVTVIESYDSTIVQENKLYEYGKDYFLGDFVTVIDKELNITIDVQITEVTISEQGAQTILDIGLTYGAIKRDPVEQININKKTSTVNENSIRYLEAKIKKLNTGGGGGGDTTPSPVTNIDNIQVNFDYASATGTRQQIMTGDPVKVLFKKIRKWLGDLKNVAYTGNYNDLSNAPGTLPNPYRLTFTGAENKYYDGSSAQSVVIPTVPDSIPANGGNADTINNKNLAYLLDYNNHRNTPDALPNPEKLIFTGAVTEEYDGSIQKTVNIPSGGTGGLPDIALSGVRDLSLDNKKNITLFWSDPENVVLGSTILGVWEGTKVVRKLLDYPTSIQDGEIILDNKVHNLYAVEGYTDKTAVDGVENFYRFFPYTTKGIYTNGDGGSISGIIKHATVYGFEIDQSITNITISYIAENKEFMPSYMNFTSGIFNYGDWENAFFMQIKPCMVRYDGTVDYYLDREDYTKKEDGTSSDISNQNYNGNVMLEIPKIYWKIIDSGNDKITVYISDNKVDDNYVCYAHINYEGEEIPYIYIGAYEGINVGGSIRSLSLNSLPGNYNYSYAKNACNNNNVEGEHKWFLESYIDRTLINLLMFLIGKNVDVQTIYGKGKVTGYSSASSPGILSPGTMNKNSLFFGSNGTINGVKIFGIENLYGNTREFTEGLLYSSIDGYEYKKTNEGGYNDNLEGFEKVDSDKVIGVSENGGTITKMSVFDNILFPLQTGTGDIGYRDQIFKYSNTNKYRLCMGGMSSNNLGAGCYCEYFDYTTTITSNYVYVSTRLVCKP